MIKKILLLTIILLITKQCVEGDPKCAQCGGDRCLICYDSYSAENGRCENWSSRVDSCLTYDSSGTCETCNYGSKVSSGLCVKIATDSCLVENSNGDCVMCDARKLVEDGKCENGPSCSLNNCSLCSKNGGQEMCEMCDDGLVLYGYVNDDKVWTQKCIVQNSSTLNCRRTVGDSKDECLECSVNYYYKAGKCVKASYTDGKDFTLKYKKEGLGFVSAFLGLFLMGFA